MAGVRATKSSANEAATSAIAVLLSIMILLRDDHDERRGLGEESDATVIRERSHLCCFLPAGKSLCRHVAADLSRPKKSNSCLTAYESQEQRELVKHEGWDEVTSVPTSETSNRGSDKPARLSERVADRSRRAKRRKPGAAGVLHRGWGLRKVLTGASRLKLSVASTDPCCRTQPPLRRISGIHPVGMLWKSGLMG